MPRMNRRRFVGSLMAGAGAAATLPMFSRSAFAQDAARLRLYWWGNPSRDERTFTVIDLFEEANPGVQIDGETVSWGDYWTKLATQTAGRNMPDIVQMDYRYLDEYVSRGALHSLEEFRGGALDLSTYEEGPLAGGMVDGELYAINIGSNTQVALFNARIFDEVGIAFDPYGYTLEDLKRIATEITEATGGSTYGTDDNTLAYEAFETFARQSQAPLFAADGSIGTNEEVVGEFWEFWRSMREAGVVPPAEQSASLIGSGMNELGLITQNTAMSYLWSNQIVGAQSLSSDVLGAAMYPQKAGGVPGQYVKPSMFLAMSANTEHPEIAAKFISDWVNDPAMTAVLGLERGIPPVPEVREALSPEFTEAERLSVGYFSEAQKHVGELPPPPPPAAGEVTDAFVRIGTEVLLDRQSISDAAAEFVGQANAIRRRAG
ncbi:ABC transporter substrate-binding protein [Pelagibacterium xiamenense]|uniref:ABC transporter substrate-binding protein n=1 Tax=Pelagibacterium xiamenense TaxID=2901140 RepID=UPI001E51F1E3|nr:extracellular solute-binding protein [Pelagibacterium xiamenense]MCD7059899.1 extracellular solute-binding protein [Pelagibacterium xiamenense]